MSLLRVNSFSVSLGGFAAGPEQSFAHPFGIGGHELHQWFVPTRTFRAILLGRGEPLFAGLDLRALGYVCVESVATEHATHVVLRK